THGRIYLFPHFGRTVLPHSVQVPYRTEPKHLPTHLFFRLRLPNQEPPASLIRAGSERSGDDHAQTSLLHNSEQGCPPPGHWRGRNNAMEKVESRGQADEIASISGISVLGKRRTNAWGYL